MQDEETGSEAGQATSPNNAEDALDLSPLFEPITINRTRIPNRFVMPAMQRGWCVDGVPLPKMAEYYRLRAEGGTGLIISEACAIDHPSATGQNPAAHMFGDALPAWESCVREVKDAGGHMLLQLWHEGSMRRENTGGPFPSYATLSPSGLVWEGRVNGRAASRSELDEVRDSFVRAAVNAREIGADGIELHGAHGFLLDQFFWHETNQREDELGGKTLVERARFPAEVVRAVREAAGPDFIIGWRMSQWKEVDFDARIAQSPEELAALLKVLGEAGVDLFHASTRRFYAPEWPGSDLSFAGWASKSTSKPVITIGCVGIEEEVQDMSKGAKSEAMSRSRLVELLRRFKRGDFSMVAVGRAQIGDPDWVKKIRAQQFDDIQLFDRDILDQVDWDQSIMLEGLARAGLSH